MIPNIEQFNALSQNEKIKLIQQHAPHLLNFLKKGLSSLSSQELSSLFEFANLELAAKGIAKAFTADLTNFSNIIEPIIKNLNLSKGESSLLDNILKKTLVLAINQASSNLYNDLKKGQGLLYTAIVSENTLTVLEGILDFKKALDKNFPGLSDTLITKASPALLALVSAYSPCLGLALKATGILSKVSDFLKTENLDKTVTSMYLSLDKIKQDKALSQIHETGTKVADIAKQVDISPSIIEKFKLTLEDAADTAQEISKNASSKRLLTVVASYAENYIPSSKKEINEKLDVVKMAALDKLKKNGVPPEIIAEVALSLDKNIEKAKSEMIKCLSKDSKIIDKVGYVLIASDILHKSEHQVQEIGKKNPSHSEAFNECTKNLKMEVNNKVRGDTSKIAKEMTADSPAKDFAKKTLGANLANEILIKRAVAPEKNLGRAPL
ncbi:MAG: hypothetical protein H0U78_00210 [Rickettsiaceae bacterium]|nr:hypothetical protein [Rickettsiaceae bacterium]